MTSHTMNPLAAPAWVDRRGREVAEPVLVQPPRPELRLAGPDRTLDLRVSGSGVGAWVVGVALAAGFTLLWVFLLLGVAGPAGTLS